MDATQLFAGFVQMLGLNFPSLQMETWRGRHLGATSVMTVSSLVALRTQAWAFFFLKHQYSSSLSECLWEKVRKDCLLSFIGCFILLIIILFIYLGAS